jgi:hypothetical protein
MTNSPLVLVNEAWKRSGALAVSLLGSRRSGCTVPARGPDGVGVAAAAAVVAAAAVELPPLDPLVDAGSSFLAQAVSARPAKPARRRKAFMAAS